MIAPPTVEAAAAELRRARVDSVLVSLGRALVELDGELDWPYFLERPEKWAGEYKAWLELGRPSDDGADEWEAFAAAVEEARR